ncbi:MAG: DNA-damage-inducible protein J [Candidatus Nomurabacteria bacterium GW2011_GWA2_40_9]|uniref:DNA-damage-inducible protein J n=1 Tax=Candidatus Nomurabacteria bacterium GW2011_GWA2_40_9 TaxID=1618734 RepID=A0A0G0TRM6_9BACT|nr:MAG: DNA-damage-inducible protein J [Candidatus Nomurabacteria bacterium GW2011_GWA2_40_9]
MTTLNIRIDEKIKEDARKTFALMGLDISSAVKLFLYQSVQEKKIPFEVKTINGYTQRYESEILKEIANIERDLKNKKIKTYKTARQMHEAILGKKVYALNN